MPDRCPTDPDGRHRVARRRCAARRVDLRVPAARRQAHPDGDGAAQRRAVAGPAQGGPGRRPDRCAARPCRSCRSCLDLDEAPLRIECYDVSHVQGTNVVALDGRLRGRPARARASTAGSSSAGRPRRDAATSRSRSTTPRAMREVLTRRFRRYLEDADARPRPATGVETRRRSDASARRPTTCRRRPGRSTRRPAPAPVRLPAQPRRRRRRTAAGQRGAGRSSTSSASRTSRSSAWPSGSRRSGCPREDHPRHPAAHQRGPLPAPAAARRGAPVRHHLPPPAPVQGHDDVRSSTASRARREPPEGAAAPVRFGQAASRGGRRRTIMAVPGIGPVTCRGRRRRSWLRDAPPAAGREPHDRRSARMTRPHTRTAPSTPGSDASLARRRADRHRHRDERRRPQRRPPTSSRTSAGSSSTTCRRSCSRSLAELRDEAVARNPDAALRQVAVVVDVRARGFFAHLADALDELRGPWRAPAASSSSTPPTRRSCAASRASAARTRSRATAGCSTASSASASCSSTCARRPTSSSTPPASTSTSSPPRSVSLFAGDRRVQLRIAVMSFGFKYGVPARRRRRLRHALPAQPVLGPRAARPHRPGRAGQRVRHEPARGRGVPRPGRRPARHDDRRATSARGAATSPSRSAAPAASTGPWRSPRR